jgi:hypothetical protein
MPEMIGIYLLILIFFLFFAGSACTGAYMTWRLAHSVITQKPKDGLQALLCAVLVTLALAVMAYSFLWILV